MSFEDQKQGIINYLHDLNQNNIIEYNDYSCLIDLIYDLLPDVKTCASCVFYKQDVFDKDIYYCDNSNNHGILNNQDYTSLPKYFGCIHHKERVENENL